MLFYWSPFALMVAWSLAAETHASSVGDAGAETPDVFAVFLAAPYPPADGFDFPVGNRNGQGYMDAATGKRHRRWRVVKESGDACATGRHPGEKWSGQRASQVLGQPVHSIGHGLVMQADVELGTVVVEHVFHENHLKRTVQSVYGNLARVDVKPGQVVKRRQLLGVVGMDRAGSHQAFLRLEILAQPDPSCASPSTFIRARRKLFVPQAEERLVLVDQASYRVRVYEQGRAVMERGVGFGQEPGVKERQGDLKTPKGMYFVVGMSQGPFSGDFADYYGGHWIKLNYPNAHDAQRGVEQGLVEPQQARQIARQWWARKLTSQRTRLGGGIGFHGWIDAWDAGPGEAHLSWGCVVMQPSQIGELYEHVEIGTMVVIL